MSPSLMAAWFGGMSERFVLNQSGTSPSTLFSPPALNREPVKFRRVRARHLSAVAVADALEVVRDALTRARPGRIGVRIVRGPHQVVHTHELAREHAHAIRDQRG